MPGLFCKCQGQMLRILMIVKGAAFILHTCVHSGKGLSLVSKFKVICQGQVQISRSHLKTKKKKVDYNLLSLSDSAFIFHICIPSGKNFSLVPMSMLFCHCQGQMSRILMGVKGALVFHKHILFFPLWVKERIFTRSKGL